MYVRTFGSFGSLSVLGEAFFARTSSFGGVGDASGSAYSIIQMEIEGNAI